MNFLLGVTIGVLCSGIMYVFEAKLKAMAKSKWAKVREKMEALQKP